MIKINLLGVAPPPSKMPTVGGPPAPKATQVIMFVGAMIICFGIVGVIYKIWSNQIADLEKRRSQEKTRQADLAAVKTQNEKYQQRLRDLETRINTIQALQNSRTSGPVELMSALLSVINKTNDVYLYSLAPAPEEKVQLKGQSGTVESMANFMAYLKNSGSFDNVQLEQFFQDDQINRLTYKFSLTCAFKSSTGGVSPMAGGPTTTPGAPGAAAPGGPMGPLPQGAAAAAAAAQSQHRSM